MRRVLFVLLLALPVVYACDGDTPGPADEVGTRPASAFPAGTAPVQQGIAALRAALSGLKRQEIDVLALELTAPASTLAFADQPILTALQLGGVAARGTYGDRGQVIVAGARDGGGALAALIETLEVMPANCGEAHATLSERFPGGAPALEGPPCGGSGPEFVNTAYLFQHEGSGTTYSLSISVGDGAPTAVAMVGTGAYQSLVPLCC